MAPTKRGSRLVSWLETHPTVKILTITSALFAFVFDLGYEFIRIRPLQEEERQARFWEIVARPSPGNSGKTQALEYLKRQSVPLHGIDLSCERNQGEWKKTKPPYHRFDVQECIGGVYLQRAKLNGVDLSTANLRGVSLDEARLKGANLAGANLRGARLLNADLRDASLKAATANAADFSSVNLENATLANANMFGSVFVGTNLHGAAMPAANFGNAGLIGADLGHADLSRARLGYADLQAADLSHANFTGADLTKANLALTNVSSASFRDVKGLTSELLAGAWAWSDTPPKDLPDGVEISRLCDPGKDGERRATYLQLLATRRVTFANRQHCGAGGDLTGEDLPEDLRTIPKAVASPVEEEDETLGMPILKRLQDYLQQ